MRLMYYPYLYIRSEDLLKALLLFHEEVKTISAARVPVEENEEAYGLYSRVWDQAGARLVDFYEVTERQKALAATQMVAFLDGGGWAHFLGEPEQPGRWEDAHGGVPRPPLWTHRYRLTQLRQGVRYMPIYVDKMQDQLVERMVRDRWARRITDEQLLCTEEIGHIYMSLLAGEISPPPGTEIVTDNPYASLLGNSRGTQPEHDIPNVDYLAAFEVPMLMARRSEIPRLTWPEVLDIRQHLQEPLQNYYGVLGRHKAEITYLASTGQRVAAWERYSELHEACEVALQPVLRDEAVSRFLTVAVKLIFLTVSNEFEGAFPTEFVADWGLGAVGDLALRLVSRRTRQPDVVSALRTIRNKVVLKTITSRIPTMISWQRLHRLHNWTRRD